MFGSFPPSLWLVCASKVYSGRGADIVYGIITLIDRTPRVVVGWFFPVSRAPKRYSFWEGEIVKFRFLQVNNLRRRKNAPFLEVSGYDLKFKQQGHAPKKLGSILDDSCTATLDFHRVVGVPFGKASSATECNGWII
jgi:hypothetical protein